MDKAPKGQTTRACNVLDSAIAGLSQNGLCFFTLFFIASRVGEEGKREGNINLGKGFEPFTSTVECRKLTKWAIPQPMDVDIPMVVGN